MNSFKQVVYFKYRRIEEIYDTAIQSHVTLTTCHEWSTTQTLCQDNEYAEIDDLVMKSEDLKRVSGVAEEQQDECRYAECPV